MTIPVFPGRENVLNGSLKIVELIFMRNFEKSWMICCETESELEVFPLLVLCPAGIVERLRGQFLFTREVAVDATLLQAGRLHKFAERAALVSTPIEDRRGDLDNLPACLFAFGHKPAYLN